ncbi:MAG TPA: hypothetical protein VKQ72_19840 [Aggregatilineales bacterium]|nr:hypothetical protein [Aggregatilineales bacterium]
MKRVMLVVIAVAIALGTIGAVWAAGNPSGTGQPGQSCQAQPSSPGNAANNSGGAFNPNGVAATHYAGSQPQNSNNPNSVSQYDVACYQVSNNGGH